MAAAVRRHPSASKPEAKLLVIEDREPRSRELPQPRGFLLLEESEWSALVGTRLRASAKDWNGRRLTAFEIPVALLANAKANLGSALELVAKRAITEIRQLGHHSDDPHRADRRHAFLTMLHFDAVAQRIYPPPDETARSHAASGSRRITADEPRTLARA